jgi:hypothetical protein
VYISVKYINIYHITHHIIYYHDFYTPGGPGAPAYPGAPTSPRRPSSPGRPTAPNLPSSPRCPGNPTDPPTPGSPMNPGMPGAPAIEVRVAKFASVNEFLARIARRSGMSCLNKSN